MWNVSGWFAVLHPVLPILLASIRNLADLAIMALFMLSNRMEKRYDYDIEREAHSRLVA